MFKLSSKIKPLVLCILDGWGIANSGPGNAIAAAQPVNFNAFWFSYPHTYLTTSGRQVGLPDGQVGNSEVGHQNIGAGKIVLQDELRIRLSIENGSFFENEAFLSAIDHVFQNKSQMHLLGLVGQGTVHSDTEHLFALLALFKKAGLPRQSIKLHLFTDGRDSPPTSAKNYLPQVMQKLRDEDLGEIASIAGRYYAMDRDNRWDRTQKSYLAICGKGTKETQNVGKLIEDSYTSGITDEFIEPTSIVRPDGSKVGSVKENDAVIFFNFRPDRARQLTRAFVAQDFKDIQTVSGEKIPTFDRGPKIPNLYFVTLTKYETSLDVSATAYAPQQVVMPIARFFSERNMRQLHIAETEKYAHVTYFFNGGRELPFEGEDRILVNSKKVASYDLAPEMSTLQITKHLTSRISNRVYDFIVVNLANADMVGHTGKYEKTVEAVKTVDTNLGVIIKTALATGGGAVITADHGNAEEMFFPGTKEPDTEHNANPAPCILIAKELRGHGMQLKRGILADVAPTILHMMNLPKPTQMTGNSLLD